MDSPTVPSLPSLCNDDQRQPGKFFLCQNNLAELHNAGTDSEEGGCLAGGRTSILTWTAVCGCIKVKNISNLDGELMNKISRVSRPEDVIFAVKKMDAISAERFVTKNVVYREVLLHRRQPPPPQIPVPNTPVIQLERDHSSALDHLSIYDKRQEDAQTSLSATLPSNVTLAPLPTAREAEVFPFAK